MWNFSGLVLIAILNSRLFFDIGKIYNWQLWITFIVSICSNGLIIILIDYLENRNNEPNRDF